LKKIYTGEEAGFEGGIRMEAYGRGEEGFCPSASTLAFFAFGWTDEDRGHHCWGKGDEDGSGGAYGPREYVWAYRIL